MNGIFLNEKQQAAVEHYRGPMMVLAGPGSGKTTVITHRVLHLVQHGQVPPEHILVITFTKAAAEEMKARFERMSKDITGIGKKVTFGTFHSFFFRILRAAYGYELGQVLQEEEKKGIIKQILKSLLIQAEDEEELMESIINDISLMKNELIAPKYYHPMDCSADDFRKIVEEYEKAKEKLHKIDFDDMLVKCYELLKSESKVLAVWRRRFPFILIDEFQDINRVQYETIKLLAGPTNHLFVVGDDDQSIYQFRGARPEFLLQFPKEFSDVKMVVLDINYRSTEKIIASSNRVIRYNEQRYDKHIIGMNKKGHSPIIMHADDSEQEALLIASEIKKSVGDHGRWKEIAVVFRTNIQARALVDVFLDLHLPFYLRDEMPNIYDHWMTRDLLAYIRLSLDLNRNEDIERIINKPKRYISKALVAEGRKRPGNLLDCLGGLPDIQRWQCDRLEELRFHLQAISKRKPADAIKYIRNIVGYNAYIKEYAEFRKISDKGLQEVAGEVQEGAQKFDTHQAYLGHMQDMVLEIKELKSAPRKGQSQEAVTLTTMHGVKGLEFDTVFIAGVAEGIIPHEKSKTLSELEEERRLFYVGMTRAKKMLYLSIIRTKYEAQVDPSRFIMEMQEVHTLKSLKEGMEIEHVKYGAGLIQEINGSIGVVRFKNQLVAKKIDLQICLEKQLLKFK